MKESNDILRYGSGLNYRKLMDTQQAKILLKLEAVNLLGYSHYKAKDGTIYEFFNRELDAVTKGVIKIELDYYKLTRPKKRQIRNRRMHLLEYR